MTTSNPYADLGAVMRRADRALESYRREYGWPDESAESLATRPVPARWRRELADVAADVSDAASAILDLATRAVGTDTMARTAASTLGRILKDAGA